MKLLINKKLIIKIGVVIAIPVIYYFLYKNGIYIKCIFHEITGFECPGCGVTRMFIKLLELDFKSAFVYNPLVFILLPFLIPYLLYIIFVWVFEKKDIITSKIPKSVLYILIVIAIIFGILRNLN